ncbi:hypothetical protein O6H91_01G106200 [Diphasiastrum complanatum]|uniref:Uncharacterized protein n=1 Tax=Diphasiastrum complanatum TaxID=34168 RepID=A0ACC2EUB0_DIPCM|nr:hypothetical protein O6H91_01G106200 [Diphasiastrum complanatum]
MNKNKTHFSVTVFKWSKKITNVKNHQRAMNKWKLILVLQSQKCGLKSRQNRLIYSSCNFQCCWKKLGSRTAKDMKRRCRFTSSKLCNPKLESEQLIKSYLHMFSSTCHGEGKIKQCRAIHDFHPEPRSQTFFHSSNRFHPAIK